MTCRKCGHFIPNEMIGCPTCAEQTTRDYQREPLRHLARNNGNLTTRTLNGVRHIQMVGGAERTFCGEPVESHHRRGRIAFGTLAQDQYICAVCREQIDTITREPCSA
jgi:hypothetical protein